MKKNNAFRLIVKFLAVGCMVVLNGSLYAAEVIIEAKIEPPRTEGIIYELTVPPASRKEAVNRIAQIMEASGVRFSRKLVKRVEDRMAMHGGGVEASMNATRTEFFFTKFSRLKLTEKSGRLPSDEQAIKLSHDYLRKTGLMPKDEKELQIDHVGGIMQMLSNARAPEQKAVVVYFNRVLDGIKVRNFGSSITIALADSQWPASVQYHWREVASREKVAVERYLAPEKIYDLITQDANGVFTAKGQVIIDKIELVLYDNGGKYIQPAYSYAGVYKVEQKEGEGIEDMPVLGYVQAIDKVYEPIHHPANSPKRVAPPIEEDE
jgi:hypothetical protein